MNRCRLLAILTWFLTTGCGRPAVSTPQAFADLQSLWPSTTIPVCWERSAFAFSHERAWVRSKIEGVYHAATPLRFNGWTMCDETSRSGLRIGVDDSGRAPHTIGVGTHTRYIRSGITLNFNFSQWSHDSCSGTNRRFCLEAVAVHEFGHALGLEHEQDRKDHPADCGQQGPFPDAATAIGPFDDSSVMNYCAHLWNNGGRLSPGDVSALQRLYGNVPSFALLPEHETLASCDTPTNQALTGRPASLDLINATNGLIQTGWLQDDLSLGGSTVVETGARSQWTTRLGRSYKALDSAGRCLGIHTVKASRDTAVIYAPEDFIPLRSCRQLPASVNRRSAELHIFNQSERSYSLEWINGNGERAAFGTVAAGSARHLQSDEGQVLVLVDAAGACYASLRPDAASPNVVID